MKLGGYPSGSLRALFGVGVNFTYTGNMFEMIGVLNLKILFFLHAIATSAPFLSTLTIFFAEWLPYLLIATVIAHKFFIHDGEKFVRLTALLFVSPIIAVTAVKICKMLIPLPRPFADGLGITPLISVSDPMGSFPSAHAAFFGALGMAIFFEHPRMGSGFILAAVLIGISRVGVGVHFPIDIIAGIALGVLVSIFCNIFLNWKKIL